MYLFFSRLDADGYKKSCVVCKFQHGFIYNLAHTYINDWTLSVSKISLSVTFDSVCIVTASMTVTVVKVGGKLSQSPKSNVRYLWMVPPKAKWPSFTKNWEVRRITTRLTTRGTGAHKTTNRSTFSFGDRSFRPITFAPYKYWGWG